MDGEHRRSAASSIEDVDLHNWGTLKCIGCLASRPWLDAMEEVLCNGLGDHHELGTEALGR